MIKDLKLRCCKCNEDGIKFGVYGDWVDIFAYKGSPKDVVNIQIELEEAKMLRNWLSRAVEEME